MATSGVHTSQSAHLTPLMAGRSRAGSFAGRAQVPLSLESPAAAARRGINEQFGHMAGRAGGAAAISTRKLGLDLPGSPLEPDKQGRQLGPGSPSKQVSAGSSGPGTPSVGTPAGRSLVPPGADRSLKKKAPLSMSHLKLALDSVSQDATESSHHSQQTHKGAFTQRGEVSRAMQESLGSEVDNNDGATKAHQARRKRLGRRSMSAEDESMKLAKAAIEATREEQAAAGLAPTFGVPTGQRTLAGLLAVPPSRRGVGSQPLPGQLGSPLLGSSNNQQAVGIDDDNSTGAGSAGMHRAASWLQPP